MKSLLLRGISVITFIFAVLLISNACKKDGPQPDNSFKAGNGFYFVNEGGFNQGNGSLSFYSYDTSQVFNNIFDEVNSRSLGDIPNSGYIVDSLLFIVVNNSGKIEVTDKETLVSEATIEGLNSPRRLIQIDTSRIIVSSLYSDSLTIIDIDTFMVSGSIYLGSSSEAMLLYDSKLFVANWSGGNTISIVDLNTETLIDVIQVKDEPSSMQLDKNNNLWVLCSGGYAGDQYPALYCIDADNYSIVQEYEFPSLSDYPSELEINSTGDTLYFLNSNIYRMAIGAPQLPAFPFVNSFNRTLYKLGYDRQNNFLIASDAVDYTQRGYIYIYSRSGNIVDYFQAEVIPGSMVFQESDY